MSIYENRVICIRFSWLRLKPNVCLCQEYKLLVPLNKGMSRSACLRKAAQWMYLVKTVAHCNVSCVPRVIGFKTDLKYFGI